MTQGEDDPKAPFSIGTALLHCLDYSTTLDPYLIMLSVKQGGIKYYFLSFWYDSTMNWTPISRTISELIRSMARSTIQLNIPD